jgi:hypothetical protein
VREKIRVLRIGDVVVTMSYPGMFTVLEINGEHVTITDGDGRTKVVRGSNVRRVERNSDGTS